ncbi:MAG TPA: DUF2569 family protein [Candidatus Nanopelagicaceae bacterium]
MEEGRDYLRDEKLTGIGGWLGFFLFTLYAGVVSCGFLAVLLIRFHGNLANAGLSLASFLASLIFLVASGLVDLWFLRLIRARQRSAIESVKVYVLAQVVLNFISGPLSTDVLNSITFNGEPAQQKVSSGSPVWWEVVSAFLIPGVWYFYFQRSRRVHLTLTR